jgi:hypothetical protein
MRSGYSLEACRRPRWSQLHVDAEVKEQLLSYSRFEFMLILKLAIAILTGLLGFLAGITQSRTADGRLTRSGRILIGSIFLSTLLSIVLLQLETTAQARRDAATQRQFERLRKPFAIAAFEMEIDYPFTEPALQSWLPQIRSDAIQASEFFAVSDHVFPCAVVFARTNAKTVTLLRRLPGRAVSQPEKIALEDLCSPVMVRVSFHGPGPRSDSDLGYFLEGPDFKMTVLGLSELDEPKWKRSFLSFVSVHVNFEKSKIFRHTVIASPKPFVDNGKIKSILDLEGGSIVVWSPTLERPRARVTRLRVYPDKSMAAYYEIPLQRAEKMAGNTRYVAYVMALTPQDLILQSTDPFLSPKEPER